MSPQPLPPPYRRLQVFALDPSADVQMDTASLSRATLEIPWENLKPGPVGNYIEVIDVDPASDCVYEAVDLQDPMLLARDGYAPSTGNPQFHQQMVYAVAMKTIANFEEVLGRRIQWAERQKDEQGEFLPRATAATTEVDDPRYVQRLRIYPHALREQNAYYSPVKKSLLFGYFNATTTDPRDELPGGIVFTCLSHDVVAHETTHAILDGMHRRLLEATNSDTLAFHEGFADIIAIFQHFTLPGLLLDQIQKTRGDLRTNNLLAKLASQFARATGQGDALRNAIGRFSKRGRQESPDPTEIHRTTEPHARGAILVAAVFDAFLKIYEHRIVDLRRIATGGTGILPQGEIHPDLARRLAEEAIKASQRVLNICIRALDYLPPVDVNYGDYLRALITADTEINPADPRRYRLAFVEAFRNRGIYPMDVRAMGEDSLRWRSLEQDAWKVIELFMPPPAVLRTMAAAYDSDGSISAGLTWFTRPDQIQNSEQLIGMADRFLAKFWKSAQKPADSDSEQKKRYRRYRTEQEFAIFFHTWIMASVQLTGKKPAAEANQIKKVINWNLGLNFSVDLEVHAVRPTIRLRPDGRSKVELLVLLTQSVKRDLQDETGKPVKDFAGDTIPVLFRGGCTLLIDPDTGRINYAISKRLDDPSVGGEQYPARLKRQMAYQRAAGLSGTQALEPFAFVHRHVEETEGY